MPGLGDWVQWQTTTGSAVRVGDTTVTPLAQVIVVRTPVPHLRVAPGGFSMRFLWNRPVAVLVERAGHVERIPIVDATRIARWALLIGSAVVIAALTSRRRKQEGSS